MTVAKKRKLTVLRKRNVRQDRQLLHDKVKTILAGLVSTEVDLAKVDEASYVELLTAEGARYRVRVFSTGTITVTAIKPRYQRPYDFLLKVGQYDPKIVVGSSWNGLAGAGKTTVVGVRTRPGKIPY